MISADYERFGKMMQQLAGVYGKKLDNAAVQWWWDALKDRDIADLERRAMEYSRKGKFFPKPMHLRPFEGDSDAQGRKDLAEDGAYQDALRLNERNWEQALRLDALAAKVGLAGALWARYTVAADVGTPAWHERMEWLKMRVEDLLSQWRAEGRKPTVETSRLNIHILGKNEPLTIAPRRRDVLEPA